jgi:hypothetical protein
MTTTQPISTPIVPAALRPVAFDLYRDIHKAIRVELFETTREAGRVDASCDLDRAALVRHVGDLVAMLLSHAEHEDAAIQPVLEAELPELAGRIASEHEELELRIADLRAFAESSADRSSAHALYVDLAAFTGAYLLHQDYEERIVMPALEDAVGVPAVIEIHRAIIGSIPPEEMALSLSLMLPAMNVDDRTELLGGMRAEAPAPVFDGVWNLATSVLDRADLAAIARRLGVD